MNITQSDNQEILVQMHAAHNKMVDKYYALATESEMVSMAAVIESLSNAIVQMQNFDIDEVVKQIMTEKK